MALPKAERERRILVRPVAESLKILLMCCDVAVAHLTTQRNAIKMLYDRIEILLKYVTGVVNSKMTCQTFATQELTSYRISQA